jgi:transcription termination/antitermination protein NusG
MGLLVEHDSAQLEPELTPDLVSSVTRQDASVEPRWYAVRTRSRHEKRVREHLAGRPGIEVYLPLWERRSRWKDRIKSVQTPLFPGYCFARFRSSDRLHVLKAFGVVDLVGPGGEPEPIPDAEIDAIRALVGSGLTYEPLPFLAEGMEVEVIRGPLMGVRGRLLRKDRGLRVVLSVRSIRQSVSVEIDASDVVPL